MRRPRAARPRRDPRGARAHRTVRASHAGVHVALARRSDRRAALLQVREPAEGRRIQGARRVQRGLRAAGRRRRARRRHALVGQPRRSACLRGAAARHTRARGDARQRAEDQDRQRRGLRRARSTSARRRRRAREDLRAKSSATTGATLVHPYDDCDVIAGQGTAALELLEVVPDLDAIVAPVGGGGLLSGTAIAANGVAPAITVLRRRARGCGRRRAQLRDRNVARTDAESRTPSPTACAARSRRARSARCART